MNQRCSPGPIRPEKHLKKAGRKVREHLPARIVSKSWRQTWKVASANKAINQNI